jgi:hypothetical protein
MKQQKQRVIAIDYFRGICILAVVINHSWIFSMPYAYLTGAGGMWTSAAELFFLLSGVTMMIVRGRTIKSDFTNTAKKIWRRAGLIYGLYLVLVVLSLCLIYLLPARTSSETIGPAPIAHGAALLWQIISFQYSVGLASFLMYYSVYLLATPMVIRAMFTRFWPLAAGLSAGLFVLASSQAIHSAALTGLLAWQLYFIMGMVIGRFRVQAISWFYGLPGALSKKLSTAIYSATILSISLAALLAFNIYPYVNKLADQGWIPTKLRGAYFHLLNHDSLINSLLRDDRLGLLRPLASLLFLAAGYLLYQRHKKVLLEKTGKFVNAMGRDTLWIFAAQAIAIPVLSAIPVSRSVFMDTVMTAFVVSLMWALTQRRRALNYTRNYLSELKNSFYEAKYSYLYRSESDS